MMSAIMPSAHTHRLSWRRWKPFVGLMILTVVVFSSLSPIAAGVALADSHTGTPETATETPTPETLPEPAAIAPADSSICNPEMGDVFTRARCIFLNIIAEILLIIASLLGRILVFMVDILISFASYNDFGGSTVVSRGWEIVRDLVNMFFIVVLLVSAFATIIGYDEGNFHYKRVLPKLLLMAVLINFSKTLILLLIDFSQVMMLTFVNAFAQAGPGNLVAALKMEAVLKFAPPTAGAGTDAVGTAASAAGGGTVDPINLILAIMLAIFMLSISLGVVVIMVAYLIFRIVGLWVALILSPIALFATALPGRLQKGLDNFTGKYWQRLTAFITGGPVMAFFLWLTFAVTQSSVGAGGLAPALKFEVSNPTVTFLTAVGNSQDIASFIVGITLMLMGLDAAVSAAQAVGSTVLSTFATRTASASKALGRLAATAPYLAGYYGARTAGRYADRRLDITGKAATAAAATVGQIPILRTALRKPLTEAMTRNRRLDLEESKELQKGLETMTPAQRAIMAGATPASILATKGQKMAYAQQMMERAAPKNAQAMKDQLVETYKNQFTSQNTKLGGLRKDLADATKAKDEVKQKEIQSKINDEQRMIENRASQYADRDVAARQGYFLDKAMGTAKGMGDQDMVRSIEEQYKKNPQLNLDKAEMAKTLLSDKKALNGMSDQAKGDVGLIGAIMTQDKALERDKDGNITGIKRAEMDGLTDKITDKGTKENFEMVQKYIEGQTAAGLKVSDKDLQGMMIGKNEKGKTRMFKMPVKSAGKGEAVAGEIERAISSLPFGEKVTGKAVGPAATLADFSGASLEPVMHESAKRAIAAFDKAKSDVAVNPTPANLDALRKAVIESVKQQGLKDTIEGQPDNSQVMAQLLGEIRSQMGRGDFSMASSLGKDIKGLPGSQQELLAGQIADAFTDAYSKLRAAGKSNANIDKNAMNIVEVSASISNEIEKRGVTPTPGSNQEKLAKMVQDVRASLNSTDQDERRKYPGAWRVIVEPEEK